MKDELEPAKESPERGNQLLLQLLEIHHLKDAGAATAKREETKSVMPVCNGAGAAGAV